MKHNISVTAVIISIFFLTQIFGLFLVKENISSIEQVNGTTTINFEETSLGPRPDVSGATSFLYIVFAIIIGTGLLLLIMKFGKMNLWKIWFFLAIFFSISIALGVLIDYTLAFFFAFILAALKMFKKNVLIHNFTEVLMYSGLAVLVVPLFDVFWIFMLLIVISIYDMYAVWKSKHMVKMAKFQTKSKLFAGLMVPYEKNKGPKISMPSKPSLKQTGKVRNAILGGGDVAFPLIFSGVVMKALILGGLTPQIAFFKVTIISVFVTLSILGLFVFAKKDKFYPAMPFVSAGCFLGYLLVLAI
ncbi:MAG: hypothetical protein KJ583_02415 [Nanoarchaeota archaeon]|nr:hypothetical protein [Nanoarchaeota archaeon]MBU1269908.1 hypothetical protein [Nanoarchaeota archaeon]MBU1604149.1 hypothetical protein [Nanoarchaeota archaeon]MBU2443453.1 hypothetical protein [Nanoarchaeota archaeon]